MAENEKKGEMIYLAFIIVVLTIVFFFLARAIATSSGSSGNANLTIYDDTDMSIVKHSNKNITFYANFTNSTGKAIISLLNLKNNAT